MIYAVIFLLMLFLALVGTKYKRLSSQRSLYIIGAFIMILFAGLRTNCWSDWDLYTSIYKSPFDDAHDTEELYMFWAYLLGRISSNYNFFLCVTYTIMLLIFYKSMKIYSVKYIMISLFVFYCNFFLSSGGFRQWCATMLLIPTFKYIIEKNYVRYILAVIVISFVHRSALLLLPLYFVSKLNLTTRSVILLLGFGIILGYFDIMTHMLERLLSFANIPDAYSYRITLYSKELEKTSVLGVGTIRKLVFVAIFYSTYIKMKANYTFDIASLETFRVLFNIYVVGIFLSMFIYGTFGRIMSYMYVVEVILVPLVFYYRSGRWRPVIVGLIFASMPLTYYNATHYSDNAEMKSVYFPYKNILTD